MRSGSSGSHVHTHADKKDKKKKAAAGDAAEGNAGFPQGPAHGIPLRNVAHAMGVLRVLACDYHVTAEQVDLIVELFDEVNHKVRFMARNCKNLKNLMKYVPNGPGNGH